MVSILIITYGREEELIETLNNINNYNEEIIELLILDNNDTNKLENYIREIFKENKKIILRYFNEGINYGVALGRNYLIKKAKGDILITLDDDIEIENINNLVFKVKKYFRENTQIGCLAFNIKNYYSRERLRHEIPHGNKKLNFEENLFTYYYIGAGHAIKKEIYDKCGLYPDDLGKYGGEERDLSFRIIENNYKILYAADIIIFHKVSSNGRMIKKMEQYYRYRNQLIVLFRYMPLLYRITSNFIWTSYYLIKNKGDIKGIIKVQKILSKIKKSENKERIKKIREVKGRIWF
ncbi:glycosyltransferase [uncultured Fusobacterium sp.]|uniref:glycosyltransferase family 2 protein n=1 Tax=uncultured Fusobacterium sp. TaxID=159267 RepID=UPI0025E2B228|nr:glycosyltransferase [uncultured Fusobacterium sp.]